MNTAIAIRQESGLDTRFWDMLRPSVKLSRYLLRFAGDKWYRNEYVGAVWAQSPIDAIRKSAKLCESIPHSNGLLALTASLDN